MFEIMALLEVLADYAAPILVARRTVRLLWFKLARSRKASVGIKAGGHKKNPNDKRIVKNKRRTAGAPVRSRRRLACSFLLNICIFSAKPHFKIRAKFGLNAGRNA